MPLIAFAMVAASPPPTVVAQPAAPSAVLCLPAATMRGATVVALGTYSAHGQAEAFKLAGSPYNVHRLPVTGHAQGPVVVVVAAYEPTLWDFSAIKGRVRAVVASGYSPQAVTGLAADTPVRFSSAIGTFRGSETCGKVRYAYDTTDTIVAMAADIRRAIGTGPRYFYGGYSIDGLDIDGPDVPQTARPDLDGVRSSVPLITEDDPSSGAQMRDLPSPDEVASRGPKLRIVAWDTAGRIVRDVGGPKVAPRADRPGIAMAREPYIRPRSSNGLQWLIWIGIGAFAFWQWRRSRKGDEKPPRLVSAPDTPPRPVATIRQSRSERQMVDLTALAVSTDSERLVMALHRYGREVQALERTRFDADLSEEITALVERHFPHAVERYRQVRSSLGGAEGERADETLTHAVERLASRLHELTTAQHQRDVSGVDEAARFIDARHPA